MGNGDVAGLVTVRTGVRADGSGIADIGDGAERFADGVAVDTREPAPAEAGGAGVLGTTEEGMQAESATSRSKIDKPGENRFFMVVSISVEGTRFKQVEGTPFIALLKRA